MSDEKVDSRVRGEQYNAQDRLVVGDEINQCLQIIVTNAGNIATGVRMDSEITLAAKRIEKAVALHLLREKGTTGHRYRYAHRRCIPK